METDGALEEGYAKIEFIRLLDQQVWSQGFAEPAFRDEFWVLNQRVRTACCRVMPGAYWVRLG